MSSSRRSAALAVPLAAAALVAPLLASPAGAEPADDFVAPTVQAGLTRGGVVVTASDAGSGVDRIEVRRSLWADEEPDWSLYTGPFQPQAHDVPGYWEYRAVDRAGNISDVFTAPGEQYVPVEVTVGSLVHGAASRVTVTARAPRTGLLDPTTSLRTTATVRLDGKVVKRLQLTDGAGTVTLPAALTAGRHSVQVHASTDFPWFYSLPASRKVTVAKAASTTRADATSRRVKVDVDAAGSAKASGTVKVTFVRGGTTKAVVRSKLGAGGRTTVAVPRAVRSRPGVYRVKVSYAGTKNVKASRVTSKKFSVR